MRGIEELVASSNRCMRFLVNRSVPLVMGDYGRVMGIRQSRYRTNMVSCINDTHSHIISLRQIPPPVIQYLDQMVVSDISSESSSSSRSSSPSSQMHVPDSAHNVVVYETTPVTVTTPMQDSSFPQNPDTNTTDATVTSTMRTSDAAAAATVAAAASVAGSSTSIIHHQPPTQNSPQVAPAQHQCAPLQPQPTTQARYPAIANMLSVDTQHPSAHQSVSTAPRYFAPPHPYSDPPQFIPQPSTSSHLGPDNYSIVDMEIDTSDATNHSITQDMVREAGDLLLQIDLQEIGFHNLLEDDDIIKKKIQ